MESDHRFRFNPAIIETIPRRGYSLLSPVPWLAPGLGAAERNELEGEIGSGAMGVVWRAQDARLGRTVTLKFLVPNLSPDHEARNRFLREAKVAAGLDHRDVRPANVMLVTNQRGRDVESR